MVDTRIRASSQIKDLTLNKSKLVADFLEGTDLDLTNGGKNATIKGLKNAVLGDSPITKSQFDTFVAGVTGTLMLKGDLDASLLGAQLTGALKGWYYIVTVAGTLFTGSNPIVLAVGDHLVVSANITGIPTNGADFIKIDNTESLDILRSSNVVDSVVSTSTTSVLSANQGKLLQDQVTALQNNERIPVHGEMPVVTNGSAVLPALINSPMASTEKVYLNGLRVEKGVGADYQINYSTKVITFEYPLATGDKVLVDYYR